MSYLEDFDDTPAPVQGTPMPAKKSTFSKVLAWGVLGLGVLYLLNPVGFIWGLDFIPDTIPGVGNLDDAAIVLIVLGALRYLGIQLPEFIETWITPSRQLPSTTDEDSE